jgi:transposase
MIDPDMRNAIFQLHQRGLSLRQISRQLAISRHTVRMIVKAQGQLTRHERSDKIQLDLVLLERLYHQCDGWIQRIHEKLREEAGIEVGYSTLTRFLREMGLGRQRPVRCDRVPDQPGVEMQHDTTVYQLDLGGQRTRVIGSLLYLRYSKRRYLRFYRAFNRFAMKCFLHEALMFWGHAARRCVIDNTNLARLRGSGARAVIVPEMELFAKRYGFQFVCHELGHSNRKAGEERSFWTVETNFLPGRTFESLADLNQQARCWATERMDQRVQTKARLIPAQQFEHERLYLHPLPEFLTPPYRVHERDTDQYGYVAFGANYYWVPGTRREEVKLLEYAECLKIFRQQTLLAEYPLPGDGVRLERFSPPGEPKPRHQPAHRRRGSQQEEQRLRALGGEVAAYLDYVRTAVGWQRHRFLRELLALSRQVTRPVFLQMAQRALHYRIVDMETLRRIAWLCLNQQEATSPPPEIELDDTFSRRPAYQEGCWTDLPDLSVYDTWSAEKAKEPKPEPKPEPTPKQPEPQAEEPPADDDDRPF